MCHVSHVPCHVSYVACHVSHVTFFLLFLDNVVKLIGGGSSTHSLHDLQTFCKKSLGFYYVTCVFNNVIQVALNLLVYQAREPSLVPAAFLTCVSAENIVYEAFVVMRN